MAKTPAEIAIDLRSKFEFYLLGLTFGILGLSIQTGKFGTYLTADAFELAGWLALFVSGVVGILRGEWIPVAYDVQSKIHRVTEQRAEIRQSLQRGERFQVPFVEGGRETMVPGDEASGRLDRLIGTLEGQHEDLHRKILRRYGAMRLAFMVGIGCLLVARGVPPVLLIAERLALILRRLAG